MGGGSLNGLSLCLWMNACNGLGWRGEKPLSFPLGLFSDRRIWIQVESFPTFLFLGLSRNFQNFSLYGKNKSLVFRERPEFFPGFDASIAGSGMRLLEVLLVKTQDFLMR